MTEVMDQGPKTCYLKPTAAHFYMDRCFSPLPRVSDAKLCPRFLGGDAGP